MPLTSFRFLLDSRLKWNIMRPIYLHLSSTSLYQVDIQFQLPKVDVFCNKVLGRTRCGCGAFLCVLPSCIMSWRSDWYHLDFSCFFLPAQVSTIISRSQFSRIISFSSVVVTNWVVHPVRRETEMSGEAFDGHCVGISGALEC